MTYGFTKLYIDNIRNDCICALSYVLLTTYTSDNMTSK